MNMELTSRGFTKDQGKNKIGLSIIIPVKNERKNFNYIDQLLDCIKKQSFKPLEVIIADAEFGKEKYNVDLVVEGGLPAVGRNNGAKHARGDYLLFLDADIYFDKDFLKNTINEMESRRLSAATVRLAPYFHDKKENSKIKNYVDSFVYTCYNQVVKGYQYTRRPFANGGSFFIKKNLFDKINGFDESLRFWEDWDITIRTSKYGKFRILKSDKAYHTVRRFDKDGRFNYIYKIVRHGLVLNKSLDKIRNKKIDYNLDHY